MRFKNSLPVILWILIIFSIGVRFVNLGAAALTESEAGLALSALNTTTSTSAVYQNISAGYFFIFTSTNFLARLLVTLASVFIVLSPFLFRKRLGCHRAILLAFLLSASPIGLAAGRHINTVTLVIAFGILLLWSIMNVKPFWISFFAIVLIFSGSEFFLLALIALGAWLLVKTSSPELLGELKTKFDEKESKTSLLTGALIAVFVFGLGMLTNPTGLTSPFIAASAFFNSFMSISVGGILIKIVALPVYELFLLGLLILAIALGGLKGENIPFGWLILGSFILVVFRGGSFYELSIVTSLLALLVSKTLADLWDEELEYSRETGLMAVFTFVVLIFAGLNFISALIPGLDIFQMNTRLIIVAFSIVLLLISTVLVSAGWSRSIAVVGLVSGIFVFLFAMNLGTFWKASGMFAQQTFELWDRSDPLIEDGVLVEQIDQINKLNKRSGFDTMVEIVGVESAALDWSLRNYQTEKIPDMKLSSTNAPFVVTRQNVDENVLLGDHRGENIYWRTNADLSTMDLIALGRWLAYREAPTFSSPLILWTNSDQFPDQQNQ